MVAKFDSSGNIQWARQFGGNDNDNVQGLYVGLTYVLVTGAVDLPMHAQDAFYRLYDFEGGTAIHVVFGDGLNDVGYGVSADARGFYVAGTKNGAALGLTPVGDNDAFLLRIANPPLTPVPRARPGPAPGNPPVPTTPQAPGRGGGRGGRGQ